MSGPGGGAMVRIFISYSSKDTDIVNRLKAALAAVGIAVWLDHEQLTPGTPNWQVAVRQGISQATTVIYVASETAAISPYVIDEISLARGKGKSVIPFWARGEEWHDCAPLGWGLTQYTDGRGVAYEAGVAKLLATLGFATPPIGMAFDGIGGVVAPHVASAAADVATTINPVRSGVMSILQSLDSLPYAHTLPSTHSLPDVPARLASLGFRGVNVNGTQVIVPPLVSVAAGPFLMGSAESDSQAYDDEKPQHRVELPAFQIGKYPVTVAEYALAVRAGAMREPPTSGRVSWQTQLQRLEDPVVCVSWQDVQSYIIWLRTATGKTGWGLPSEAQWEKAARWDATSGVSRAYPWGDTFDRNRCNTSVSGFKTTTPVGAYPASDIRRSGASPCGAEDMAGNVWEWTSSINRAYPYTSSDGREVVSLNRDRTLRGGSWDNGSSLSRAAYRLSSSESTLLNGRGFRLMLSGLAGS